MDSEPTTNDLANKHPAPSSDAPEAAEYPHHRSLNVLPHSGKIEELKRSSPPPASASASPPHNARSVIDRAIAGDKSAKQKSIEEKVVEVLRTIFDPELPVNIYDLGLIYAIDVQPDNRVNVKMTLTAPACPVAGSLPGEVERRIETLDEVVAATVELVWEPQWSREMMSEAALLELGLL